MQAGKKHTFSLLLGLLCCLPGGAQQNSLSMEVFIQKITEAQQDNLTCAFRYQVAARYFFEEDTVHTAYDGLYARRDGRQWLKLENEKDILLYSPDSSRQHYFFSDSIVYTRKDRQPWENAFFPLLSSFDPREKTLVHDSLRSTNWHYVLYAHYQTDSSTLFSRALSTIYYRKTDLLPVIYITQIDYQGTYQYKKEELIDLRKTTAGERSFTLDSRLPVKKMVNCLEGRLLADFTPYRGMELPVTVFPVLGADSIDLLQAAPRVILLDCFYVSCMPCRKAVPALNAIHNKYAGRGVLVVGFDHTDRETARIRHFMQELPVKYPVVMQAPAISSRFPVHSFPTILVFDRQRKFVKALVGYHDQLEAELEALVNDMLKP